MPPPPGGIAGRFFSGRFTSTSVCTDADEHHRLIVSGA
jgi:hypothetical protein